MAVRNATTSRLSKAKAAQQEAQQQSWLVRYFPAWLLFIPILVIVLPSILTSLLYTSAGVMRELPGWVSDIFSRPIDGTIAPLFTDEVSYWSQDIGRWSVQYDLDPNLLATVMQIESCGHPTVSSYAGAQGLFQVMPFHFASTENQLDPETNAMRGAGVLNSCLYDFADGDTGLAMACYNGGPSVISRPYANWSDQTQRYYMWGTGIYGDAQQNASTSETLNRWLAAGGQTLCNMAADTIGLD